MSARVFVVMASTGEYSDRSEWPVCAYRTLVDAERHSDLAAEVAKRLQNAQEQSGEPYCDIKDAANPYDPKMQMQYTGTGYFVLTVELRDALPEVSR